MANIANFANMAQKGFEKSGFETTGFETAGFELAGFEKSAHPIIYFTHLAFWGGSSSSDDEGSTI